MNLLNKKNFEKAVRELTHGIKHESTNIETIENSYQVTTITYKLNDTQYIDVLYLLNFENDNRDLFKTGSYLYAVSFINFAENEEDAKHTITIENEGRCVLQTAGENHKNNIKFGEYIVNMKDIIQSDFYNKEW